MRPGEIARFGAVRSHAEPEPAVLFRYPAGADDVGGLRLGEMQPDGYFFIRVGVDADAPLLLEHSHVVLESVECVAAVITCHVGSPLTAG